MSCHEEETPRSKNKKFCIVNTLHQNPMLREIEYGTMVMFQGYVYVKVNKRNLGAGITLKVPNGHSVLCNILHGSLRMVDSNERVDIMEYVEEPIRIARVRPEDRSRYLRC